MVDTLFSDGYIETDAILEAMIGSDPRTAAVALKAAAAATQCWYCQEATRHIDRLILAGQKYDTDIVAGAAVQRPKAYKYLSKWIARGVPIR